MEIKCIACSIEIMRNLAVKGEISMETFAKYQEQMEWKFKSDSHKKRLVCSQACYESLMRIVIDSRVREEKCTRAGCRHLRSTHGDNGMCTAVRCKCHAFKSVDSFDDEIVVLDKNGAEIPPQLQEWIAAAKKIL